MESPTDMLIRGALRIGLRPVDFEYFTVGGLMDVLLYDPPEEQAREATQADCDAFGAFF